MESINLNVEVKTYSHLSEKSLQSLIHMCGGSQIGRFLLNIPTKYVAYELQI